MASFWKPNLKLGCLPHAAGQERPFAEFKFTSIRALMNDSIFYVEARWGGSEESPPPNRLRELIAQLEIRDEEHPDTWMIHEDSGWILRLDEDRFACLENQSGASEVGAAEVRP